MNDTLTEGTQQQKRGFIAWLGRISEAMEVGETDIAWEHVKALKTRLKTLEARIEILEAK